MAELRALTVTALTRRIALTLQDFGAVAVEGELTQIRVVASGHCYATLKDADATIALVIWRSTVVRIGRLPAEGSRVVVHGNLDVYAPRGGYQLIGSRITAVGAGDLLAKLQELKERLAAEGLFSPERRRPLPFLPRAVGIATAAGSAALADLLHSIRTRFPQMPVVVAPCIVQGMAAPPSIVDALARLAAHPDVDVIICGRGGGSLEDLWAFNDERVVRAVAAFSVPVVSAVGHETDHVLSDLAADVRAKTPTAAGELVVPVASELQETLLQQRAQLDRAMDAMIKGLQQRLAALANHRALSNPQNLLNIRRQRLDEAELRLETLIKDRLQTEADRLAALQVRLEQQRPEHRLAMLQVRLDEGARHLRRLGERQVQAQSERLAALAGRLNALSPLAVIHRGYSVIRRADGAVVRQLADAPAGSSIRARLEDGWLEAEVTQQTPERLREDDGSYRV